MEATRSAFPEQDYDYVPVSTIKDVFDAVQAGDAPYGVVPFENSTHGVVTFTLDNLADRHNVYGGLAVCHEVYLDVHHFLLGYKQPPQQQEAPSSLSAAHHAHLASTHATQQQSHQAQSSPGTSTPTQQNPHPPRPRARPLAPLDHVRRVLSHPQAFGQSAAFLATYLRGVDAVDVSSTSRAAEAASRDATGATAAIAAEMAADLFGLDVLARCIEDRDDNTTRFFVLRRKSTGGSSEEGGEEEEGRSFVGGDDNNQTKGHKSLLSFTVPHESPGALAGVLDVFSRHGLNLTSINSLPSLAAPFQYLFFVEFEGSRRHDPAGRVERALGEIDRVAAGWRWLGSWERQR